jgi:hypothetical protein
MVSVRVAGGPLATAGRARHAYAAVLEEARQAPVFLRSLRIGGPKGLSPSSVRRIA